MTFTGRIRLLLIAAAILPPLAVTAVIYFKTMHQIESDELTRLRANLNQTSGEIAQIRHSCSDKTDAIASSEAMARTLAELRRSGNVRTAIDPSSFGMDFLEITDAHDNVLYSYNRPGLVGQKLDIRPGETKLGSRFLTEYDFRGPHPALAVTQTLTDKLFVYSGIFLEDERLKLLEALLQSKPLLITDQDQVSLLSSMEPFKLYENAEYYEALLIPSSDNEFVLSVRWDRNQSQQTLSSLLLTTMIVAFSSALIAILLGIWLTGRAKREVDNLVAATARVAAGDFGEPVMAYEEGEFSQLADAFTSMTMKLKGARRELVATEKIAAWQTVGRTIAHELKNPLSPIAISADDLRRSYQEKLPNFESILYETTSTIRSEVGRLTKLLDEFVGFARMRPPEIINANLNDLSDAVGNIYRKEIDASRLTITNRSNRKQVSLDPESITQLLINLIKNSLEADETGQVTLRFEDNDNFLVISVEDSGPGFSADQLESLFTPFKTTKAAGTGLGLVVSYRIARDHNGTLELYNLETGGAGVRVSIPA